MVNYRPTLASKGSVLLPHQTPRSGVWIYGSTGVAGVLAHQVSGWLSGGPLRQLVLGRAMEWEPPVPVAAFESWLAAVAEACGGPVRSWIVQLPRDRRRRRFNLLLLGSDLNPLGFAKFTANAPNPLALAALARFSASRPSHFWAPGLLLDGRLGPYTYLVTTAMPNMAHGPARLTSIQRRRVIGEIQDVLSDVIVTGVPTHGDFAPWNVRKLKDGVIAVIDWEETSAGVAAADELWYIACVNARRKPKPPRVISELMTSGAYSRQDVALAARFWLDRLSGPEQVEIDANGIVPAHFDKFGARITSLLRALT